ncbi:hypothetical protein [Phaeovulum sp. W22_SRMD_FR3]|uniref:hypothetical protein n=1 Tax=Phaeovulum sp. W22_SRMD_FR3 TaxID=3240274 RepID=UPI003F996958
MSDTFQAHVQYDDYTGSVAADRADELRFVDFLKSKCLCESGEVLAGIRLGFSGNHGRAVDRVCVVAYLISGEDDDLMAPSKVRAVEVDISTADLFSFFKRLDVVMTKRGMDLSQAVVEG